MNSCIELKHFFFFFPCLATDTDSYIMAVESEDINKDLAGLSHVIDFSTYDPNHPLFNDEHKSELGR